MDRDVRQGLATLCVFAPALNVAFEAASSVIRIPLGAAAED
jgi:hypothetical protein